MINGSLEQFLDTGWYSEATLYYRGFSYWCEAQWDDNKIAHFSIYRYPAINVNNSYCMRIIEEDGSCNEEIIYEIVHPDIDYIKKSFLEAEIFDGKCFWKVENEIAWLDDNGNVFRKDIQEFLAAVNAHDLSKMKEISSRKK